MMKEISDDDESTKLAYVRSKRVKIVLIRVRLFGWLDKNKNTVLHVSLPGYVGTESVVSRLNMHQIHLWHIGFSGRCWGTETFARPPNPLEM